MVRYLLLKVMVYRLVVILHADLLDLLLHVALVARQLTLTSLFLVPMALLHLPMVLYPVRLYLKGLPPLDACRQPVSLVVDRLLHPLGTSKALFRKEEPPVRLPLPALLLLRPHRPALYLRSQRLSWRRLRRWSRSRCWVK